MFEDFRYWVAKRLIKVVGGAGITVGSYIADDGTQSVAFTVTEARKQCKARMSPDGARRIAAQMNEWADAADKNNAERSKDGMAMAWRAVLQVAAKEMSDQEECEPAPATT